MHTSTNTRSIRPPALTTGDTIAIVCTARKITTEELQPAIAEIKSRGFKVRLGDTINLAENQFGGTDAQRIADMQQQLDDPEVKAILCARGGYGTVRLLDQLDFSVFVQSPKWIIGYSDVTALHAHINQNYGVQTLHASMPVNFSTNTANALNSLFQAITTQVPNIQAPAYALNRVGEASGRLIGGNLSVLYSIAGSTSDMDTDGAILLLEDLDEYLYHIDRMMMQLKRAGKLDKLAGLVIGGMTDMNDNTIPFGHTAVDIIRQQVERYNYPVGFNFPIGHLDDNRAVLLGATVKLSVTNAGSQLAF